MTGVIPPLLGWPIVAGCIIAAVALIRHGKQGRNIEQKRELITGRLEDVSPVESEFILAMSIELQGIHGYNDLTGLFADRASGIPLNELKTRPCSQCGVPRNQRGKHGE